MYTLIEEEGLYVVQLSLVFLKGDDLAEEDVVIKVDKSGRAVEASRFATLDQAITAAAKQLLDAADGAEALLDRLEYRLEAEERVDPLD